MGLYCVLLLLMLLVWVWVRVRVWVWVWVWVLRGCLWVGVVDGLRSRPGFCTVVAVVVVVNAADVVTSGLGR